MTLKPEYTGRWRANRKLIAPLAGVSNPVALRGDHHPLHYHGITRLSPPSIADR